MAPLGQSLIVLEEFLLIHAEVFLKVSQHLLDLVPPTFWRVLGQIGLTTREFAHDIMGFLRNITPVIATSRR